MLPLQLAKRFQLLGDLRDLHGGIRPPYHDYTLYCPGTANEVPYTTCCKRACPAAGWRVVLPVHMPLTMCQRLIAHAVHT